MSRCYPYPPPGYTLRRSSEAALIESIKLQKEREKAERKEKRREKKERKKEKKEKRKENGDKKHQMFYHQADKTLLVDKSVESCPKPKEVESELLEKSSLTEEHGLPVCLRSPSTSSDSTENSNKRKRQTSSVDVNHNNGKKLIRIRVVRKQQNGSNDPTTDQKEQLCSTSGKTDFPPHIKVIRDSGESLCSISQGISNISQGLKSELICSTSQHITAVVPVRVEAPCIPRAQPMTAVQREQLLYTSLFENWTPPPKLQEGSCVEDDLDWLFHSSKKQIEPAMTRARSGNESLSRSSTLLQPLAQYLPEADIFAFPFTVPF